MAKKREGKEWSPRGGRPPAYTKGNLPPEDEILAGVMIPRVVRVFLSWIGEGLDGEYDPENPSDVPVLRMDVRDLRPGGEEPPEYSYATAMPATIPLSWMEAVAQRIAGLLADEGGSWKRRVEELTWLNEDDAKRIAAEARKGGR